MKTVAFVIAALILMLAGLALCLAAFLGLLEISSIFDGLFGQSFWTPAGLAVVAMISSKLFVRAGNKALEKEHARMRNEAPTLIREAIERINQQ